MLKIHNRLQNSDFVDYRSITDLATDSHLLATIVKKYTLYTSSPHSDVKKNTSFISTIQRISFHLIIHLFLNRGTMTSD